MKKLIFAAALFLLPSAALAQCNGVFPNNTVCGNITGSNNTPRPTNPTAFQGSAGGTNGQVQYNNNGALAGESQVTTLQGGTNADNSGAAVNDILIYNGTGFIHNTLATAINTICSTAPLTCTSIFGYAYAAWWGVKCDGTTDDGPAFNLAVRALKGQILYTQAGKCHIATQVFYNTFTTPGVLTVPGMKIAGQGRGVTILDTAVANNYMLAVNPAWASLHKSMFLLTPGSSGALAANTYFVQITVTDNLGNEVNVAPARSATTTGASGSISLTLQPINIGYSYNIYIGTSASPTNRATVSGADAIHLPAGAATITAFGTAATVPNTNVAVWQEAELSNLSITNSANTTNASGVLWFRTGFSHMFRVFMQGLTSDGLGIPNWVGDSDGSFLDVVDESKFDTIGGWCINTGGNALEFSNFSVTNSAFNLCGTLVPNFMATFTIASISNANPGIVTTTLPNTLQAGDKIYYIAGTGMSLLAGWYRVGTVHSSTSFDLYDLNSNNINTTSLGTYTAFSGGEKLGFRPPIMQANGNGPTLSGAIAWTGLIGTFTNNGFTQNKNTNFYFTEAGSNDNAYLQNNDMENTYGVGLYAASILGMIWNGGECLSASAIGETTACIQFGTGLGFGGAQNVTINNIKVRSDSLFADGFDQFFGAGSAINQNTFNFQTPPVWQTFTGTAKFNGFLGNPPAKFWARLDGKTGSVCTIKSSYNVTSCVRNSTGNYTITYTTAMLDTLYTFTGSAFDTSVAVGIIAPTALNVGTAIFSCSNVSGSVQDCDIMSVEGFGNPQ